MREAAQRLALLVPLVTGLLLLGPGTSSACVGAACLQIWSTADGGGALTIEHDFSEAVQTFPAFCTTDRSVCLYSTIDPGFMAPTEDVVEDAFFRLVDGTRVRVEIVSVGALPADTQLTLSINGQKLTKAGDSANLGTMPTIHNHPSWQLLVPGDQFATYELSYKLTTDSPVYSESAVFTVMVTNISPTPGAPTPTPSPTPPPTPCVGDCDGSGDVTIDELVQAVNIALGSVDPSVCAAADADGDSQVTIDEVIAAVDAAANGCPMTVPATLDEIQATIFTPRCAIPTCHDSQSETGDLDLAAGTAFGQLVGVPPDVESAANAGLLRVDPEHPENSFLLVKLTGPPLGQGSPMPLTGAPLTQDEIELIRNWILQGAQP